MTLTIKHSYLVAVYEEDRAYGGPEEGGWWYDCGNLQRVVKVFPNRAQAQAYANRMNDRFRRRERFYGWRSSSSVAYIGGEYRAHVCEDTAPPHYPETRPVYE